MSENIIKLKVCSYKGILLEKDVAYVRLPGVSGDVGVFHNHTPSLFGCKFGEMSFHLNKKEESFILLTGLAHITTDSVTVLTDHIEAIEHIDKKRAMESQERAEKRIQEHGKLMTSDVDLNRARQSLNRANLRLEIVAKHQIN